MNVEQKLRAGEKAFTLFLLLFSLLVLIAAYLISGFSSVSSPGTFPMLSAAVMVASALALIRKNHKAAIPDFQGFFSEMKTAAKEVFPSVFVIYSSIIIVYMIALQPLHFLPSSFLFLLGSILFLKGSSPLKSVAISGGLLAGIYLIFHYLFLVVLP